MNEWSRLKLVTPPASPVVSLAEAKKQVRAEYHTDDDAYLTDLVGVATAFIEGPNGIGTALSPQSWRLSLDYFPCEIRIPLGPVTAITSITYADSNGDAATVDQWRVDFDTQPCRVWPERDIAWPAVTREPGAVKVVFVAGYETCPADLKHAIRLIVGHLYEHREAVTSDIKAEELPMGVQNILERYRVGRFA